MIFLPMIHFLGFLDNSVHKSKTMDGVPVFSPSVVSNMQFDRIVLMSTYYQEIIEQLLDLGVAKKDYGSESNIEVKGLLF